MNPNIDKMPLPELRLPGATNGVAAGGFEGQPARPEVSNTERGTLPPQPSVAAVPMNPGFPSSAVAQPFSRPVANQSLPVATQATDLHDIEKEYVSKAKAIIEHTKADPYTQSRELSRVKAEFIKKQYGKDIKLSER